MYYAWLKRESVFTCLKIFLKQFFLQETHTVSKDEDVWIKDWGSDTCINFVKIIPTVGD